MLIVARGRRRSGCTGCKVGPGTGGSPLTCPARSSTSASRPETFGWATPYSDHRRGVGASAGAGVASPANSTGLLGPVDEHAVGPFNLTAAPLPQQMPGPAA